MQRYPSVIITVRSEDGILCGMSEKCQRRESRTSLDGGQQLEGVGYEAVRGESREKIYLIEMLEDLVSP